MIVACACRICASVVSFRPWYEWDLSLDKKMCFVVVHGCAFENLCKCVCCCVFMTDDGASRRDGRVETSVGRKYSWSATSSSYDL